VHVAQNIEASQALIVAALKGELFDQTRSDEFLTTFIRPHGLGVAATPLCVEAFEELATLKVAAQKKRLLRDGLIRAAVWPMRYPIALMEGGRKKRKTPKVKADWTVAASGKE
jgi:hypothetical protein